MRRKQRRMKNMNLPDLLHRKAGFASMSCMTGDEMLGNRRFFHDVKKCRKGRRHEQTASGTPKATNRVLRSGMKEAFPWREGY